MVRRSVSAYAPASVANVGAGFDIFGFALEGPGDVVDVCDNSVGHVRLLEVLGGDDLPRRSRKNVASAVVRRMWEDVRPPFGVDVVLHKGLAVGSGMGSSAASAVAAAVAANELFGKPFTDADLLMYCRFGEKVACGSDHPDNVAASFYGGFIVVRDHSPLDIIRIPAPGWHAVVVRPHVELRTRDARKVLPRSIRLSDAVRMAGNAAAAIAAVHKNDLAAFGRAVASDPIIQQRRMALIPSSGEVADAARAAGAGAVGVSGSGPSMFAVCELGQQHARDIGQRMRAAWVSRGINANVHVSLFGAAGARVIRKEGL